MRYVKGHFCDRPRCPVDAVQESGRQAETASALIVFSAFRVSNPPTRPGETAQNLMSSARPVDTICRVVAGRSQTGGDTGEGDERACRIQERAHVHARIPDQVRQFLGRDYASSSGSGM